MSHLAGVLGEDTPTYAVPLLDNSFSEGLRPAWVHRRLWRTRERLRQWSPGNLVFFTVLFGVFTGLVALVYNSTFVWILKATWTLLPTNVFLPLLNALSARWRWFPEPDSVVFVYILIVATLYGALAGAVQAVMGYPGDLPDSIDQLHTKGFIPIKQAPSMFLCSTFSIVSGSSLGPEAPILCICAASVSWISMRVFGHRGAMLRACTLMGMASGLSALFGVGLGGGIFAFEVLHTMGLQFFEVLNYAVACALICLFVMRALWDFQLELRPFGAIWDFQVKMPEVDSRHLLLGIAFGFVGAAMAYLFMEMNRIMKKGALALKLDERKRPILCGALGGLLIGIIGVFLPAGMFWSEYEIETVANTEIPLEHVWPKGGFWGLKPWFQGHYTMGIWIGLAFAKLLTINISVVAGMRGGFIFPLMFSGACLGRGLAMIEGIPWFSDQSPVLASMVLAGSVCTGITRTPFAVALILTTLSGDPGVAAPTLCGALTTFFLLMNKPFFKQQRDRADLIFKPVNFGQGPQPVICDDSPTTDSSTEYRIAAGVLERDMAMPSSSKSELSVEL